MTSGIYSITNTVNGKQYIGSSQDIERRWRRHQNDLRAGKHHSAHLQRAWGLDGEGAFDFTILVECAASELLAAEQRMVDTRKSASGDHGYNVSAVVGSRRGVPHSPEVRAKLRAAAARRPPLSRESRAKLSASMKKANADGRLFSPEHRRKISESQTGKVVSAETRAKIGAAGTGRVTSEETKVKLRAGSKGKPLSDENYQKLVERSRTTNVITDEIRAKMVASRGVTYSKDRNEVAGRIVELKEMGLSFSKIAKRLTEDKVPTLLSRRRPDDEPSFKWFPMIVRTIYNEAALLPQTDRDNNHVETTATHQI